MYTVIGGLQYIHAQGLELGESIMNVALHWD
jgi:hypothetical protein